MNGQWGTKMLGNVMLWYQEVDAGIRLGANRRSYLKSSVFDMEKMVDQKTIKMNCLRSWRSCQYIPSPRDNSVGSIAGKGAGVITSDLSTRRLRRARYSVTGSTATTKGQDHRPVEPPLFCVCPLQREAADIPSGRWSGQRTSPGLQIRRV